MRRQSWVLGIQALVRTTNWSGLTPVISTKELSESLDSTLGLCYNSVSVEHSSIGKDFWFSSRQEQFDSAMLYHIIFGAVVQW